MTGCSLALACRALDKPRSWLYYRRRLWRRQARKRPEVEEALGRLLVASPVSYGYRRLHALLKRQ